MNGLSYPYEAHPVAGTTVEVAPGVRWLTMPMGGSLSHINLYLIEDNNGWWVVDTGIATTEVRELWHQIFDRELGGKPVTGVICTHFHPDHTGQATMITEHWRCRFYMTRSEYYQARAFSGGGGSHSSWRGEEFYKRAGMDDDFLEQLATLWQNRPNDGMSMQAMPSGFHALRHGDELSIGGRAWRVAVGSGHSPEHACLYCPELKLMLAGDQILPVITSNVSVHPTEPEANPLNGWMKSLDAFLRTPEDTLILPAHNLPFYGVRTRLRDLMEHHEDRMLAVEEACQASKTAQQLLPVLFERKLDARQTTMALGEAVAHLHLLMHRNRIRRDLGADGRYAFRSIDPKLAQRLHPHDDPSPAPQLV